MIDAFGQKQPGQNFPDNFKHIGFDLTKRRITTRTDSMIVALDEHAYDEDEKSVISLNNLTAAERKSADISSAAVVAALRVSNT